MASPDELEMEPAHPEPPTQVVTWNKDTEMPTLLRFNRDQDHTTSPPDTQSKALASMDRSLGVKRRVFAVEENP